MIHLNAQVIVAFGWLIGSSLVNFRTSGILRDIIDAQGSGSGGMSRAPSVALLEAVTSKTRFWDFIRQNGKYTWGSFSFQAQRVNLSASHAQRIWRALRKNHRAICASGVFLFGSISSFSRTSAFDALMQKFREKLSAELFFSFVGGEQKSSHEEAGAVVGRHDSDSTEKTASSVGGKLHMLHHDVELLSTFYASKMQNYFRYACSVVGGTVMSFYACPQLACFTIPLTLTMTYAAVRRSSSSGAKDDTTQKSAGKSAGSSSSSSSGSNSSASSPQKKLSPAEEVAEKREHLADFVQQRVTCAPVIRAFGVLDREIHRMNEQLRSLTALQFACGSKRGRVMGVLDLCLKSLLMGICMCGSKLVLWASHFSGARGALILSSRPTTDRRPTLMKSIPHTRSGATNCQVGNSRSL